MAANVEAYYNVIPSERGALKDDFGEPVSVRHFILTPCLVVMAAMSARCDSAKRGESPEGERLAVAVSIPPQLYFVERIGGEFVAAQSVLSPGQSHGAFDPSAKQIAALAQARAFFRVGVASELSLLKKLKEVSPKIEIVDTRQGIALMHMAEHAHGDTDGHGEPGHVCGDNELDPHIWLDPVLVRTQARTICDTLKNLDPAHAAHFEQNLRILDDELTALDAKLRELLSPFQGRTILVFHPSFTYFCSRYGLVQVAIETEGKEPGARRMGELIEQARAAGVRVVFSQAEYSSAGAEAVAQAIGAKVIRVSPYSSNWAENMMAMGRAMADSLTATE